MRFKYGYVEHSVICPDGDGFWSLLWFDNRGDTDNVLFGAEIDLNECFGNGTATQANCHKWPTQYGTSLGYEHVSLDGATYGAAKKYYHPDGGNWADGYHTFGFLWDATQMTFTADGKIWFSYDITQTPEDVDAFVDAYLYMKLSFSVTCSVLPSPQPVSTALRRVPRRRIASNFFFMSSPLHHCRNGSVSGRCCLPDQK